MEFPGQHILTSTQFDKDGLLLLFAEAKKMEEIVENGGSDLLKGKIMATLFYEPSTRTRFSFEAAMLRLGGSVLTNADMATTSSAVKMESLSDTGKVVSQMADVIVMRHAQGGAVESLASGSDVPVLNAGDGPMDHPTQGLLDLYTIWKTFGKIDGLKIGLVGDLKYSRVLHSNSQLLSNFDLELILVSPTQLALPPDYKKGLKFKETEKLSEVIGELDVICCNRLQKERFDNPSDCEKYRGSFVISSEVLKSAKDELIILNPLPRREELPVEVDNDPRAKYFEQVKNGVAVRMALLKKVLNG